MTTQQMNVNSTTYYGTATTTSGGTAITVAKLPDFDKVERIAVSNLTADPIIIKTGIAGVTVGFPASNDTGLAGTIIPGNTSFSLFKERSHTTFAVDSLSSGSATYSVQYGNGV